MTSMTDFGRRRCVPRLLAYPSGASGPAALLLVAFGLTACGGGSSGDPSATATSATTTATQQGATATGARTAQALAVQTAATTPATSQRNAVRLADQATFGPNEKLVADIVAQGPSAWIAGQMAIVDSARYTSGKGGEVHQYTGSGEFCDGKGDNCWRDWSSSQPLVWDFYRNAVSRTDQLRQRVAFALQQILVTSNLEVDGTYGLRFYQNTLLNGAFGNYRQLLKNVALSPLMGDYLDNANNDKLAPNENFSRELLQLFSVGTCDLNPDGSLVGGACRATYTNDIVRGYAYALTGWTYPAGGATSYGCWPAGMNCRYYQGSMVPVASYHDSAERKLLSGVTLAAGHAAPAALEKVLDSLMAHPNMAPFIGRQLIQHMVTSNPSPAYVARVSAAFDAGRFQSFGAGVKGDLAATVAAVLLDVEARSDVDPNGRSAGRLRDPVLLFTGVLRALGGRTDGEALGWWWGGALRQHVFRAPSVFNFYPPNYPVAGTKLVGSTFGIHSADAALERLNYLTYLLDWNGSAPEPSNPDSLGTIANIGLFVGDAPDAAKLVDRLSLVALGRALPSGPREQVIKAVAWWTPERDAANWKRNRVKAAAYLVFASPHYQVQR